MSAPQDGFGPKAECEIRTLNHGTPNRELAVRMINFRCLILV
jgi:hypothetical protein